MQTAITETPIFSTLFKHSSQHQEANVQLLNKNCVCLYVYNYLKK